MRMLSKPFWQKMLVAATGPLVAALVGGLVVKSVVEHIQDQKKAIEQAAQDRLRDQDLRMALIKEMSSATNSLYFALQNYSRQLERADLSADAKALLRGNLDAQYQSSGIAATELETRLSVLFPKSHASKFWHAARDILQVQYFKLIGLAPIKLEKLYEDNASDTHPPQWHSGLTKDELTRMSSEELMSAYHQRLNSAVQEVLEHPVVRTGP
jgi:hypothetical protein